MRHSGYRPAALEPSVAGASRVGPARVRLVGAAIAVLIGIVLVFVGMRLEDDLPHIIDGTVPDDDFDERYVRHWVIAHLHIWLGLVYLLGALLQLAYRFRIRHYAVHRRLGRTLVAAGLVSGILALAFGLPHAYGGRPEAIATAIFGTWFLACLVAAFTFIRHGDVVRHRRWMIRAFAVCLGIGSIRIWIGVLVLAGMDLTDSFAVAFWVAFTLHVVAGELWLRTTPHPEG